MFVPQVGVATLQLLEKLDVQVDYPFDQTCCGVKFRYPLDG
jgi:L-lactate dehydrogenase complex protein LldE